MAGALEQAVRASRPALGPCAPRVPGPWPREKAESRPGRDGARRPWRLGHSRLHALEPLGGPSMGRGAMFRIGGFRQASLAAASASTGARGHTQKQC